MVHTALRPSSESRARGSCPEDYGVKEVNAGQTLWGARFCCWVSKRRGACSTKNHLQMCESME